MRSNCSTSQSRSSAWVGVRPLSMRASTGTPAREAACSTASSSGHRDARLLLHRRVERELERDQDQVGGDERRLLRSRDADRRVEDGRVEVAARERHEDRVVAPGAQACGRRCAEKSSSRARSVLRVARSATTRMSMPGSSRTIRERSEPPKISRRRDSSGVPTKTYVEPRSRGDAAHGRRRGRRRRSSRKWMPSRLARRRRAASWVCSSGVGSRPAGRTQSASISRAEPLRRAPGAAQDPLRLRLRLDEREDALGDRLLAQRVERLGCRRASTSSATSRSASSRSVARFSWRKKFCSATSARSFA